MLPERTCIHCQQVKPATTEFFHKTKNRKDGLATTCKACAHSRQTELRRQNREQHNAKRRAHYAAGYRDRYMAMEANRQTRDPQQKTAERMRGSIQTRVREDRLPHDVELLSTPFLRDWLLRQPACSCCGVDFDLGPKNGQKADASASIDRFNPADGYTIRNTRLICWRCNNIKRNYTEKDLRMVASWMERERQLFDPPANDLVEEAA